MDWWPFRAGRRGARASLIGDPGRAGVAAQMRAKVQTFRLATADPWVLASEQGGEVFQR